MRLSARPRIGMRTRASASAARSTGTPASEAGGRLGEGQLSPAVGREHRHAGGLQPRQQPGQRRPADDVDVEEAAGAGPHGLPAVGVGRPRPEDDGTGAARVGGAQHGARVARVGELGEGHGQPRRGVRGSAIMRPMLWSIASRNITTAGDGILSTSAIS